jgi:hypothetical protein
VEQRRPEVTVRDPRNPAPEVPPEPAPVQAGRAPRLLRRWAVVGSAAVLVGAGALAGADAERDRRAATSQQRLDGVVDIALAEEMGSSSTSYHAVTGTGTVEAVVRLVNSGPRAVEVTAAEIAGARFDGTLPLAAHDGSGAVLLTRTVRCPRDGSPPPAERDATRLVLRVRTAAGPRSAVLDVGRLPVGYVDEQVQRACGFPPLAETVQVSGAVLDVRDRTARIRVDLRNSGRHPARLVSLTPSRGMVVLTVDGESGVRPVPLPPASSAPSQTRSLDVVLGLTCAALISTDALRPFEQLALGVDDGREEQIQQLDVLLQDDEIRLHQLAARTCASG